MWHQVESVVAGTRESLGQINRRSVSTTQRASSTKPEASAHGVPFRPCIASLLQVKASWSLAVIAAGPENAAREDCSYMNVSPRKNETVSACRSRTLEPASRLDLRRKIYPG